MTAPDLRAAPALPANLSERAFQDTLIETAILLGWRCVHIRAARTERGWRTPYEGHPGLPDIILARDGVVLLVELKSRSGRPSPEQRAWLTALGAHGRLWRPANWAEALDTLKHGPKEPAA